RLLSDSRPANEPRLLAHVLAHEIGHVLQRNNAHSESGVMKAHWTADDLGSMARRPLEFSEVDRQSIRATLGVEQVGGSGLPPASDCERRSTGPDGFIKVQLER